MQKITYILISLSVLIITSCSTIVENVDFPYEERLVISSFISPQDTLIEVKVAKTKPVTGTFSQNEGSYSFGELSAYKPLEGVMIEISDGQKTVVVPYTEITYPRQIGSTPQTQGQTEYAKRKGYFLNTKIFPILAGKTYNLSAKFPNIPVATASCTIPKRALTNLDYQVIGGTKIDSVQQGYGTNNGVVVSRYYNLMKPFTVLIKDFPSEENFYSIAYFTRTEIQYKDFQGNPNNPPITLTRLTVNQEPFSDFISDYKKDGSQLEFRKARFSIGYYNTDISQNKYNSITKSSILKIYIAVTDKAYYQYTKAVAKSEGINSDDPFSEPVLTYTNVQGGLGVFAGFNTTVITIDLLK